jgi:hypothetical protein
MIQVLFDTNVILDALLKRRISRFYNRSSHAY